MWRVVSLAGEESPVRTVLSHTVGSFDSDDLAGVAYHEFLLRQHAMCRRLQLHGDADGGVLLVAGRHQCGDRNPLLNRLQSLGME